MSHGYPLQGADPLSGRSGHERRACTQGRHAFYVGGRARPAGNSQRAIDATLMILALRNVTCVADWMADVAQGDDVGVIDKALDEFRRQLPDLVPARDTLEHFDEYAVGQGRLQKKAPFPFAAEVGNGGPAGRGPAWPPARAQLSTRRAPRVRSATGRAPGPSSWRSTAPRRCHCGSAGRTCTRAVAHAGQSATPPSSRYGVGYRDLAPPAVRCPGMGSRLPASVTDPCPMPC